MKFGLPLFGVSPRFYGDISAAAEGGVRVLLTLPLSTEPLPA